MALIPTEEELLEDENRTLRAENERLRAALKTISQNDCAQRGCDVYEMARAALADQGKG